MAAAMLTACLLKASTLRCCSCSFINDSAAPSPNSKLEAAYHKADKAIQNIVNLLAAA